MPSVHCCKNAGFWRLRLGFSGIRPGSRIRSPLRETRGHLPPSETRVHRVPGKILWISCLQRFHGKRRYHSILPKEPHLRDLSAGRNFMARKFWVFKSFLAPDFLHMKFFWPVFLLHILYRQFIRDARIIVPGRASGAAVANRDPSSAA